MLVCVPPSGVLLKMHRRLHSHGFSRTRKIKSYDTKEIKIHAHGDFSAYLHVLRMYVLYARAYCATCAPWNSAFPCACQYPRSAKARGLMFSVSRVRDAGRLKGRLSGTNSRGACLGHHDSNITSHHKLTQSTIFDKGHACPWLSAYAALLPARLAGLGISRMHICGRPRYLT